MSESGDDEFAGLDAGLDALNLQIDEFEAADDDLELRGDDQSPSPDDFSSGVDEEYESPAESVVEEKPPKPRADPPPDWLLRALNGGPLGNTDMAYQWWTAPILSTLAEAGGVRLVTTAAGFVPGNVWVPEAGRWDMGDWFTPQGNSLGRGGLNFHNVQDNVVSEPLDNVHVIYELDGNAVAEITRGEEEHCADFQEAFDVSYKALEAAVTAMTGQLFFSEQAAIAALVASLVASGQTPLVPENPFNLDGWPARLAQVADALESHSPKRDRQRDHSTKGYTVTDVTRDDNDVDVTLAPIFDNPHHPASAIVRLEEIEAVYASGDDETGPASDSSATAAPGGEGTAGLESPTGRLAASLDAQAAALAGAVAALKGSNQDSDAIAAIGTAMAAFMSDASSMQQWASQPGADHLLPAAVGLYEAGAYAAAVVARHEERPDVTTLDELREATQLVAQWAASLTSTSQ